MKTTKLILTALLSGTMLLGGCIDLSSDDKEAAAEIAKGFLDDYAEEDNIEKNAADAREEDYLGSTDIDVTHTSGSARIGGEIAIGTFEDDNSIQGNTLNVQSSSAFSRSVQSRAVDTIDDTDFTVSFINGRGQVEVLVAGTYTVLIHYPDNGDPQFIIEGVGDGVNYIVVVKITVDGEDIDLKSLAFIPEGAEKSERAIIDPISTVVAQAVEEKVVSGFFSTGGDKFSQTYIADLNETMTAIIEVVIEAGGSDITLDVFIDAVDSGNLDSLVSKLLSNEEIDKGLDTLEDLAVEEKFEAPDLADLSGTVGDETDKNYDPNLTVARNYMDELFRSLFGGDGDGGPEEGGGAPKLFVDFFGDQFEADEHRTIGQIFTALESGLEPHDGGPSPFNADAKAAALDEFKFIFDYIYGAVEQIESGTASVSVVDIDGDSGGNINRTLAQAREFLDDIPSTLLAVFPPNATQRTDLAAFTTATSLDVPQAITMVFFVMDVFLDDGGDDNCNDGNCDGGDGGGDDFDPGALLNLYGFDLLSGSDLDMYGSVEINWLGIHPGSMWLENDTATGGMEVDVLNAYTCVDDFFESDGFEVSGVTLTYPTGLAAPSDRATINLVNESIYFNNNGGDGGDGGDHDGPSNCWVWDTWQEQRLLEESGNYEFSGEGDDNRGGLDWAAMTQALVDDNKIISDFTSGDYVVTASYTDTDGSHELERLFYKTIITGLQQLNPRLTTPTSQPRFPEGNVSDADWTAFYNAQNAFVQTTFPVGAIGTIVWDAPAGLAAAVPDGVIAAYNLNIGRHSCTGDGPNMHCEWMDIFNTWEDNVQIFDTQFELPGHAKDLLVENTDVNSPYEVHLGISFIDAETGEYLGNGGHSNSRFLVGEAIDENATFTLTGGVENVPNAQFMDEAGTAFTAADYKVAMINEVCDETGCSQSTILSTALTVAADGTISYSLMPTITQAKGTANGWINVLMYIDVNGDDILQAPAEANNFQGEPIFWSHSFVNFNTWGGILRLSSEKCSTPGDFTTCEYSEQVVVPNKEGDENIGNYEGPTFDTEPMEFMDSAGTTQ